MNSQRVRRPAFAALVALLPLAGCGVEPPGPLVAKITVDRMTAGVGSAFSFQASVLSGGPADGGFSWDFGDGSTATGETATRAFDQPGLHSVQLTATASDGRQGQARVVVAVHEQPGVVNGVVMGEIDGVNGVNVSDAFALLQEAKKLRPLTARDRLRAADLDLDGRITVDDAMLLAQAITDGTALPSRILPSAGAPGTIVRLIAPELFAFDTSAELRINNLPPVPVQRSVPGYGRFMMPLEVGGPDPTTIAGGPVPVELVIDGATIRTFVFTLEPTPPVMGDPGMELLTGLDHVLSSFPMLEQSIEEFGSAVGASASEHQALEGLLGFIRDRISAARDGLAQELDGLDPETRRSIHLVANANGLPQQLQRLRELETMANSRTRRDSTARTSLSILDVACEAQSFLSGFQAFGDNLTSTLCPILAGACVGGGAFCTIGIGCPVAAIACPAAGLICGPVATAFDWLGIIVDLLPRAYGLRLEPNEEQGIIRVFIQIDDGYGLCRSHVGLLKELIAEEIIKQLVRRVIMFDPETELLEGPIDWFASVLGNLIDSVWLDQAIEGLKQKVCNGVFGLTGFEQEISSDRLFRADADGPVPLQLQLGAGPIQYQCPQTASGTFAIQAFVFTCDHQLFEGRTSISCGREDVTITMGDNGPALDDIFEVRIDGTSVLTSNAPVRSISETVPLTRGQHTLEMIGRAAPDGIGTYFIDVDGATFVAGSHPLSGDDLNAGTVFTWEILVQ